MTSFVRLWLLIIAGCLAAAAPARATGFFVNQHSVVGLGRVDAGNAAAGQDPSTVFFNPAGMTQLWDDAGDATGTIVSGGAHLLIPRAKIKNSGSTAATPFTGGLGVPGVGSNAVNPAGVTPITNSYAVRRIAGTRLYLGMGISAPFGLAVGYERGWFGRYDSIEASLLTINLGPAFAYRVTDFLSIGGGLDVQYAKTRLFSAIPNPLAPGGPSPATDAFVVAKGDDWSVGYNVGILVKPAEQLRLGVHYRSQMDHKFKGSVETSGFTGALAPFNGKVDATSKLDLPAVLSFAAVLKAGSRLSLYGDFTWYEWSDLTESRIVFADGRADAVRPANLRDTYAIALGAEYRWSDELTLRGGLRFDRTPTIDETRDTTFADANRYWLGVGASYRFAENAVADFAFNHVFLEDTSFNIERRFFDGLGLGLDSTTTTSGNVSSVVNNVSFSLRYSF